MRIHVKGKTIKLFPHRYQYLPIMNLVGTKTKRLTLQERQRLEIEYCLSELNEAERRLIIGSFKECREKKGEPNWYEVIFTKGPSIKVSYFSAEIFGYTPLKSINFKQLEIC